MTINEFLEILGSLNMKFEFELLVKLFEYVISPADRIVNGAVYTPESIREFIISNTISNITIDKRIKVADISCGCGGFLYSTAREIKRRTNWSYGEIFEKLLYGLDIQEYSIIRSKLLLSLLAIKAGEDKAEYKFNLFVGDALTFAWGRKISDFNGFSIIVGNPPYVCSRNIKPEVKELLKKWAVCSSGHPDLYIPFFQIAIELLAPNGLLGYITMNSFFKSLNGRALRQYLQDKSAYIKIIDFGTNQIFKKRSTYTCICIISLAKSENINYAEAKSLPIDENNFKAIPYRSLSAKNGWNFKNFELIERIEQTGIPFSKLYKTRNGIATLRNDIYIFKPVDEDSKFYYLQNGSLYKVEKDVCKDIVNPNFLTNEVSLKQLTEKLIFPYQFIDTKATIYTERFLKEKYPQAFRYLKDKREILEGRDKGEGEYIKWFAFGRTQCLEKMKYKLFFPHITPHIPNYVINTNENMTFYNGIAVIGNSVQELQLLKKIMSSRLFWFYIVNTSKPYSAGYYSLSKNYIKNFGIYSFTPEQKKFISMEHRQQIVDKYLEELYGVKL